MCLRVVLIFNEVTKLAIEQLENHKTCGRHMKQKEEARSVIKMKL